MKTFAVRPLPCGTVKSTFSCLCLLTLLLSLGSGAWAQAKAAPEEAVNATGLNSILSAPGKQPPSENATSPSVPILPSRRGENVLKTEIHQEINQVPPTPQGLQIYVNDRGNLLTAADSQLLQSRLQALDESGIAQVSVLTLPGTSRELAEFGPEIMNAWGIQHKGRMDGLLILVNANRVRTGQSRGRIFVATGYRLEGVLPDAKVGRILDNTAVPAFAQGQYSSGVRDATLSLVGVLRQSPELQHGKAAAKAKSPDWFSILSIVFIIMMITNWFNRRRRGGGAFSDGGGFGGGFFGGYGGGYGDGGGGFGGGFGGGDDSSGGGGAER